jgi:hypothetical protein
VRSLFRVGALAASVITLAGCGQTDRRPGSRPADELAPSHSETTRSAAPPSPASNDNDNDNDNDGGLDDVNWGKAANAADMRAVTTLVRAYYAVAAAGDGARACGLLYPLFAEDIPELYGEGAGPPELRGTTCATVVSKFLRLHREELRAHLRSLSIAGLRVRRRRGLVLLRFRGDTMLHELVVHREHRNWKVDALIDARVG